MGALSELETDIDGLYARVDEMKKRIIAHSNEEIEKLKQQITVLANEEARVIVEKAKSEANAESAEVAKQAEKSLAVIKKNVDSYFDKAVDSVVRMVLGDTAPLQEQKAEAKATRTRRHAEEKPAS